MATVTPLRRIEFTSSDPREFLPFRPTTSDGARQWRDATRYVDRLLANPAAAAAYGVRPGHTLRN